jgi:hypothetical protein
MTTASSVRRGKWFVAATLALGAAFSGVEARGQSPADPTIALAEALFRQGRELAGREQWAEACPKLAESQRLDPKLGTLLNLAHCHEKEGKTATAWAEYTSAEALARRTGQKEREDFARERITELQAKLAHVLLRMAAPPAGLGLQLDGKPVDVAALNVPLPVDPGKHRITATAPGKRDWSGEVDVPSKMVELSVPIPPLEAAEVKPVPPAPLPSSSQGAAPIPISQPGPVADPENDPVRTRSRTLMMVGFGVGSAGLIVGAVTGISTLAKASEILPSCDGSRCAAAQADNIATATYLANASNIGFALAVVGVGIGITGVVYFPGTRAAPRPAVSVEPVLGPGMIGVRGAF